MFIFSLCFIAMAFASIKGGTDNNLDIIFFVFGFLFFLLCIIPLICKASGAFYISLDSEGIIYRFIKTKRIYWSDIESVSHFTNKIRANAYPTRYQNGLLLVTKPSKKAVFISNEYTNLDIEKLLNTIEYRANIEPCRGASRSAR